MNLEQGSMDWIFSQFNFTLTKINHGIKYFGFIINPNDYYTKKYWSWFVSNIKGKLNLWCNKWLSRGGRLVMMKYVLEVILVYWASVAYIPRGTMDSIRTIFFNFLWRGSYYKQSFPYIAWKRLTIPKEMGGWGLKLYPCFSRALEAKGICI